MFKDVLGVQEWNIRAWGRSGFCVFWAENLGFEALDFGIGAKGRRLRDWNLRLIRSEFSFQSFGPVGRA